MVVVVLRKIWENEKTGMLPVSQDVFMDKVWAIERERVFGIETLVEAEIASPESSLLLLIPSVS